MLSPKQRDILKLFRPGFEVTKQTVIDSGYAGSYYHNGAKYIGEILGRMVRQGLIERVKPGVFRLPDKPPVKQTYIKAETADDKQLTLF